MDIKIALQLKDKRGVVSVARGRKITRGKDTGLEAIVVGVRRKIPESRLRPGDIIPHIVGGQLTDVIQVGEIKVRKERTEKWRPMPGGVSIGHRDITAGSSGCLVYKKGVPKALSNNHVLGNMNKAVKGDPVYQPGVYDGGITDEHLICKFDEFVKVDMIGASDCSFSKALAAVFNFFSQLFGRQTRMSALAGFGINEVDCAIADYINPEDISPEILGFGEPAPGIAEPVLDMKVKKSGRTSAETHEAISQVDAFISVNMGDGEMAFFGGQFGVPGEFSEPGDSGSVILTEDGNERVGLLFAGGEGITFCNKYSNVVKELGLDE